MPKITIEFNETEIVLAQDTLSFIQGAAPTTAEAATPVPTVSVEPIISPKPKTAPATTAKSAPTETSAKPSRKSSKPTFEDFRTAVKAAKGDHGPEFCMHVVTSTGTQEQSTLLKTIGAVPKSDYAALIELLKAGPQAEEVQAEEVQEVVKEALEEALGELAKEAKAEATTVEEVSEDEPEFEKAASLFEDGLADDDDGLGDDDEPQTNIDPVAVMAALKAYAKEHSREEARAIMESAGANTLQAVKTLGQPSLAEIMKAVA